MVNNDFLMGYGAGKANGGTPLTPADEGKVVSNGALVAQTSATYTENDTYDTTLINSVTVNVSGGGGGGNSGVEADYRGVSYAYIDTYGDFRSSAENVNYINAFWCTGGTKYIIFPPPEISHNRFRVAYFYNKSYSDFKSYIEAAGAGILIYNCDEHSTRDNSPYLDMPYVTTPAQDGELIVVTDNQSTTAPAYCVEAVNTN